MRIGNLIQISNFFYSITIILAIPFYLALKVGAGHRFNFSSEDVFWICVILLAILAFFINSRTNRLIYKIIAGTIVTVIFYGALQIAWYLLNFRFGDDIPIVVVLLLKVWPLAFLTATGFYVYSLFFRTQ